MADQPPVPVNPVPPELPPKFDLAATPPLTEADKFSGLTGYFKQWANFGVIGVLCGLLSWVIYRQDANSSIMQDLVENHAAERREEAEKSRSHGDRAVEQITAILREQQKGRDTVRADRAKDMAEVKALLKQTVEILQEYIKRILDVYLPQSKKTM